MMRSSHHVWRRVATVLIGLFFITSAYYKTTESFFGMKSAPLATDIQYWITNQWMLPVYIPFIKLFLPYLTALSVLVILAHLWFGLSLLTTWTRREAATLFLIIQGNLFLATMLGWGFFTMVGASLWMGFYALFSDEKRHKWWPLLTLALIFLQATIIIRRFEAGDYSAASFESQFTHFTNEVMSISVFWKRFVAFFASSSFGSIFWHIPSYLQLIFFALLFTRYRLFAGQMILVLFMLRGWTWLSVMGAEATVHVLLWYTWLAEEWYMMKEYPNHNRRILPCVYNMYTMWTQWLQICKYSQWYHSTGKPSVYFPIFFTLLTIFIVVTLILPASFGLQNYNQWGGMYDEHWCQIDGTSSTGAKFTEYAGFTGTRRVYSGPMNNQQSCLAWAQSRCGKKPVEHQGNITSIIVSLKGEKFVGEHNICSNFVPSKHPWFGI